MAHMLTDEEIAVRIQRAVRAARNMERETIVQTMQDFADAALGQGEIAIAQRIVQVIEFVRGSVAAGVNVEVSVDGPGTPEPVLAEPDLPPVREIPDDVEIKHLIRHTPRTALGLDATLPIPRD